MDRDKRPHLWRHQVADAPSRGRQASQSLRRTRCYSKLSEADTETFWIEKGGGNKHELHTPSIFLFDLFLGSLDPLPVIKMNHQQTIKYNRPVADPGFLVSERGKGVWVESEFWEKIHRKYLDLYIRSKATSLPDGLMKNPIDCLQWAATKINEKSLSLCNIFELILHWAFWYLIII